MANSFSFTETQTQTYPHHRIKGERTTHSEHPINSIFKVLRIKIRENPLNRFGLLTYNLMPTSQEDLTTMCHQIFMKI